MKRVIISLVISVVVIFSLTIGASAAYYGDVDGNGKITASDARSILRAAAKLDTFNSEKTTVSDVNGDKKITASDARTVLRMAAKLEALKEMSNSSVDNNIPLQISADTSLRNLKKGGTAIIDIEVIGDLGDRELCLEYDESTFRCEWVFCLCSSPDFCKNDIKLMVSPLEYTSIKNIKVYVKGCEDSIYVEIPVSVTEDGRYDYVGYPGMVDFGAYIHVSPYINWFNKLTIGEETATATSFFYRYQDLLDAGFSEEYITEHYLSYLESFGYECFDHYFQGGAYNYCFYSKESDSIYFYAIKYDMSNNKVNEITDIVIVIENKVWRENVKA